MEFLPGTLRATCNFRMSPVAFVPECYTNYLQMALGCSWRVRTMGGFIPSKLIRLPLPFIQVARDQCWPGCSVAAGIC